MRILFDEGFSEELNVTAISPGVVRLDDTPLVSSDDLRFGDVIEVEFSGNDRWRFVRLRSRSGLESLSFVLSQEVAQSRDLHGVLSQITGLGVHWEHAFGGVLILHGSEEQLTEARALLKPLMAGA